LCTKVTYTNVHHVTQKKLLAMRDRGILFRVSISTVGEGRPRVRRTKGVVGPRVRRTKG
jgi:hypothetical protein